MCNGKLLASQNTDKTERWVTALKQSDYTQHHIFIEAGTLVHADLSYSMSYNDAWLLEKGEKVKRDNLTKHQEVGYAVTKP